MVQADSPTVIILPQSIILSKNRMVGKSRREDVERLLLLMEALFAKKIHIRDLALSNMLSFIRQRVHASNMSDIAMVKIYSRAYSAQEIE